MEAVIGRHPFDGAEQGGGSIALPEMLRRGYDKVMITGVIQAGSSLGILVPPSVVLYGMIARQQQPREDAGEPELTHRLAGDRAIAGPWLRAAGCGVRPVPDIPSPRPRPASVR